MSSSVALRVAEWQVFWDAGLHFEVHVFATRKRAERFMSKLPPPDILEGGIVHPPRVHLRRVTFHGKAATRGRAVLRVGEEGGR